MHFWSCATAGHQRHQRLIDIAEVLVKAGADIDPQRATDGMTPLHRVVLDNEALAVRERRERGEKYIKDVLVPALCGAPMDNRPDYMAPLASDQFSTAEEIDHGSQIPLQRGALFCPARLDCRRADCMVCHALRIQLSYLRWYGQCVTLWA